MKKTRVFFLLLACAFAGLFATVSVNESAEVVAVEIEPVGPTAKVFVSTIGFDPGEQVHLRNISIVEKPVAELPPSVITDVDHIATLFAKGRIEPGTVFAEGLMVADKQMSEPLVPEGFRSTTISAHIDPSICESLEPGLSVDVIALMHDKEQRTVSARRILKGIDLLARPVSSDREKYLFSLPVLTKDDDAEMLLLAMRTATLHVSLNDAEDDDGRPQGLDYSIEHLIQEELVAHVDQGADQTQVETGDGTTVSPMDVAIEQSDMTDPDENTDGHHQTVTQTDDPIHQYDNPNEQTQDIASQAVEKPEQKVFRMEIITPAGSTRYQWDRLDGRPVVIRGLPMIRIAELDEELETELSPTSSQESKIER
ncbi:MAG: hypothetical protein CMM04_16330 [Rhodopirellula sp.]|nr:hypothetical protein [Rhodopirellula sp.]